LRKILRAKRIIEAIFVFAAGFTGDNAFAWHVKFTPSDSRNWEAGFPARPAVAEAA
jgi:hypothetical protein